jgi:micrococcal nuclease
MRYMLILSIMWCCIITGKEIKNIEIIDGDTIAYVENNKRTRVRLYGIDAPELHQPYGLEAKHKLKLLLRKKVTLHVITTDRYRREIGVLYVNKTCINTQMLLEGYAWYYPEASPKSTIYQYHEQYARDRKMGMWSSELQLVEPWLYRK